MWKIVHAFSTDRATVRASNIQTDSYKRQRGYRLVHLSTTLKHDADVCPIAFIGEADMLQERCALWPLEDKRYPVDGRDAHQ